VVGDWFETIADVEATAEEADRLGAEVLSWLVAEGVVLAEPTDCVLGGPGHPPGPHYARATIEPCDFLLRRDPNGLRVLTGRSVFYSMGLDRVVCPHCQAAVLDERNDVFSSFFSPAIDEWYSAGGTGTRACPYCGKPVGLNEWDWSPPWGFGYLGFEFWNWPLLDPGFVAEVSHRLGHGTVRPCGKL
jgi:endogenous inhibitor of DNA gyrase (YacG/DUF329 family)